MDILNGKIRLYNHELSPIGFPSQHNQNGVFLRGREEEEEFVMERVSFDDIEIENTKSDIFKVGRVRFHPDEEDEIYLKLGIEDKENIKSDKELVDLLMDDTIENVKKISNIKSPTLISRMKSMLFLMERSSKTPPHNISAVVTERNEEIKNGGKRNPNSEINRIIEADRVANEEGKLKETLATLSSKVERLEKENSEKDEMINKSQNAIQDLLKIVEDLKSEKTQVTTKTENKSTNNKPGRPKKEN